MDSNISNLSNDSSSLAKDLLEIVKAYVLPLSSREGGIDPDVLCSLFDQLNKNQFLCYFLKIFFQMDDKKEDVFSFEGARNIESFDDLYSLLSNNSNNKKSIDLILQGVNYIKNKAKKFPKWLDIEKIIELLVTKEPFLQSIFCKKHIVKDLLKGVSVTEDESTAYEYYIGLQGFTVHFSNYLRIATDFLVNTNEEKFKKAVNENLLNSKYCKSLNERSGNLISSIDLTNIDFIYTFNYTNISEKLYEEKGIKIIHVNGSCQYRDEIFGYSSKEKNKISNNYALMFEKRTQRIVKNVQVLDASAFQDPSYNVVIYGHSCSPADADVLREFFNNDKVKMIVILCLDIDDLKEKYKNLIEILGRDELSRMTSNIQGQRVFFAVCDQNDEYLLEKKIKTASPISVEHLVMKV